MAKFLKYEQCPKCASEGRDKSSDNLGVYSDNSAHCFSCGYHRFPPFNPKFVKEEKVNHEKEKAVLPSDFTREVPAEGWRWLLQYGLPYSYWKKYTGYSPKENRLILTFGEPIRFSIGRALSVDKRKWKFYGDGHGYVETISTDLSKEVVLVEDLISAHKVAQVTSCICLFGTHIHDNVIKELNKLKRPIVLWLDADQYSLLAKKIAKLQTLVNWPVQYVFTPKDPKEYTSDEIRSLLAS